MNHRTERAHTKNTTNLIFVRPLISLHPIDIETIFLFYYLEGMTYFKVDINKILLPSWEFFRLISSGRLCKTFLILCH